jgi:hypothetical protein
MPAISPRPQLFSKMSSIASRNSGVMTSDPRADGAQSTNEVTRSG